MARTPWIISWIGVGILASIPVVGACEFSYLIWAIRDKPADPLYRFVRNRKAGYIDTAGKIVIKATLPVDGKAFGEFHEGLLAVKEGNGYRYLDRFGTVAFRGNFWLAFDFSEGLAPASGANPENKWGFIDRTGQFVIDPQYSWVEPFSEGLARISVTNQYESSGYINRQGTVVIPPKLSHGSSFHEGLAAVIMDGPCRSVGSCERAQFRPAHVSATYDCRYSFIDKSGQPVSKLRFDDAKNFSEGLAPVRIGDLWGYVDRSAQISITPRFDSADQFSEGLAAVSQDAKWGFIDHSGRFVIAPQFDSVEGFSDGRALVSGHDDKGVWSSRFIDKTGTAAFPGTFAVASSFTYGLAPVKRTSNGEVAWINTSGKPVFTFRDN